MRAVEFMNDMYHRYKPHPLVSYRTRLTTFFIELFSSPIQPDLRTDFKDLAIETSIKHGADHNHSHLEAAQLRCYANTAIDLFASIIGRSVYSVSMSRSEDIAGVDGTRMYHGSKDVQMPSVLSKLDSTHVIKLTDVDYYVDLTSYLNGNYVLLYTFDPKRVAGQTTDGIYMVNNHGHMVTKHNGGSTYIHGLWDYESDYVYVSHWTHCWLYFVERKYLSQDRVIVFFNPIRRVLRPFANFLEGHIIQRKNFKQGEYAINYYLAENYQPMVSLGRLNEPFSIELPQEQLAVCTIREDGSKEPILANIERIIRTYATAKDPILSASIVYDFIKHNKIHRKNIHYTSALKPAIANHYQTLHPLILEDGDNMLRVVGPVISNGATAPVRSHNNDVASVQHRLTDVSNPFAKYPPFIWRCLNEYLHLLLPSSIAHTLVPISFEDQYRQFNRPSQRGYIKTIINNFYMGGQVGIKSFQKAESYSKVTAPRNISTLPMEHNFRLGQFMIALAAHVKTHEWYAFGKHPSLVTARIQDLATKYTQLQSTDLSKCDGSVGYIHYILLQAVVKRAFPLCYHNEISTLLYKEARASGITKTFHKYTQLFTTLSGSSDTSIKNSLINSFNDYVSHRRLHDVATSWCSLGLYGGDDGVSTNPNVELLNATYAQLGMHLKADVVNQFEPLPFLGRIYLDPWTTNQSIADVKRHIVKLHLSVSPKDVPADLALHRKADGFLITDPTTPILSDWARAVKRCVPQVHPDVQAKFERISRMDVNYMARTFETPFPPVDRDFAHGIIINQLNLLPAEYYHIISQLGACHTRDAFFSLPELYAVDIPTEISASVNGQLVLIPDKITQTQRVYDAASVAPPFPKVKFNSNKVKSNIPQPERTKVLPKLKVSNNKKRCTYYAEGKPCAHLANTGMCRFLHK